MLLFNKKQRYILYFIHLIKTRFSSDNRKQRADEGSDFNQIFVFYNSMLFLSISKEHKYFLLHVNMYQLCKS